ncbi:SRPBCC family protein [Curtobacterium sp. RHCKG23]|uniref:SRPBCC family protein n=1 Tax=Curtobacterium citri TaxID=3055139 RepID=A0ABT7T509_9MICO|nr:SRPBCC family protein [Curtobacterium citri]MDM7884662.1 SRPBCC family protein [Curtobacterium citri]
MAKNVRIMHCTPEQVFDVLRDGWLYPTWVVGASRMRGQDPSWPAVGSELHHSFGIWPFVIDDTTTVLEVDEPRRLVIEARGWPFGEARVEVDVEPHPRGCRVTLREEFVRGAVSFVPGFLAQPGIWIRNHEGIRRLRWIAEGRAAVTPRG